MRRLALPAVLLIAVLATVAMASPAADVDPPHIVSLDFWPKEVNTALSDQVITFTTHLTDDLSGVTDGKVGGVLVSPSQVWFYSPSGNQFTFAVIRAPQELISGDALDGVYLNTFELPRYCETGTWRIRHFLVKDDVGNWEYVYASTLEDMGLPVDLVVTDEIFRVFLPAVTWQTYDRRR